MNEQSDSHSNKRRSLKSGNYDSVTLVGVFISHVPNLNADASPRRQVEKKRDPSSRLGDKFSEYTLRKNCRLRSWWK
ncbi:hypothetical protein HanIR_Chr04g0196141 [Helianthus annuus]|nr:hypothetical protein HanIR_Chr04g0196141 [Helianthus annuus]